MELVFTGTFPSDTEAFGTLEMTSRVCQASTRAGWKTIREEKLPAQAGLDPGKAQPSDLNGSWAGAMGEARPVISFTVVDDRVTEMTLEWDVPLTEPCRTYPGSPMAIARLGGRSSWYFFAGIPGNEPPKIAGKAWKATVDAAGPGQVKLVFTGTFTSESEAAGALEFTATACKGSARAAWKATKQN